MHTLNATYHRGSRFAIATLLAATSGLCLHAQQAAPAASTAAPSMVNLQAAFKAPAPLFDSNASSSSADAADPVASERANLAGGMQPPPRRRYGRPRYTDNQHNPDGSSKYAFEIGGGLTLPTGGTHNYLTPSYNLQAGVGRNFNKNLGVMAEFDWANFGIQTNTLNNLLGTYNSLGAQDQNGAALTQLGGSSHVWSLTIDPIYSVAQSETLGFYVIGGGGFYHKTANFTIPSVGQYCDPYYGCYQYQANQSIDKYTSNAVGANAGVGFTYKFSRFANQKFFAEARYVFVDNQPKPYSTGTSTSTYFNVFPQNSARTTFVPITVGIRF